MKCIHTTSHIIYQKWCNTVEHFWACRTVHYAIWTKSSHAGDNAARRRGAVKCGILRLLCIFDGAAIISAARGASHLLRLGKWVRTAIHLDWIRHTVNLCWYSKTYLISNNKYFQDTTYKLLSFNMIQFL